MVEVYSFADFGVDAGDGFVREGSLEIWTDFFVHLNVKIYFVTFALLYTMKQQRNRRYSNSQSIKRVLQVGYNAKQIALVVNIRR